MLSNATAGNNALDQMTSQDRQRHVQTMEMRIAQDEQRLATMRLDVANMERLVFVERQALEIVQSYNVQERQKDEQEQKKRPIEVVPEPEELKETAAASRLIGLSFSSPPIVFQKPQPQIQPPVKKRRCSVCKEFGHNARSHK